MSIVTQNSVLGRIKKPSGESPKQVPERLPGSGVDFLRNDFNDGFGIRKNQKDTDFILSGFPRTNFIDSRGNTPQEFNINKPFDLSIDKNNSRLLKLHNDEFNFKEYYAQAKGSGELGARRSSRGFTEPFIIRDVGDQWGERISPTDAFPTAGLVRGGIATHIDRSFAAAQRVGKFLLTPRGIVFTAKQALLQTLNVGGDLGERANIYNPLSPLQNQVPFLHFDRHIDTPTSTPIRRALENNPIVTAIGADSPFANARVKPIETGFLDGLKSSFGLQTERPTLLSLREIKINQTTLEPEVKKDPTLKVRSIDVNTGEGDKVNLIPYGKEEDIAKLPSGTVEDLDFIPFKFKDVINDKIITFRAILSGITDTFTPEYSSERYVGRPDSVYVYQGTSREISFTFDIYPKTDKEMFPIWQKLNYLAGLTYPSYGDAVGGGKGMVAPFCQLTIGDMYKDSDGYISSLTYTVQDQTTWETEFAKLPKYLQVAVNYIYIGRRLPSSTSKHFEVDWVAEEGFEMNTDDVLTYLGGTSSVIRDDTSRRIDPNKLTDNLKSKLIGNS